jgi:hypothetical protein
MLFGAQSRARTVEIPSSTLDYIGRPTSHEVTYGECDLMDTHITRDGWPMSAVWSFTQKWIVRVDTGEETTASYKGWSFDSDEMVATCPHGHQTEIDGDTPCCTSILSEVGI